MVNTCVCCGDIVPEGTQVCYRCSNVEPGAKCPECGSILRVMYSGYNITENAITGYTLFHCEKCLSDWEKESKYIGQPVVLKRKFWG